MRNLGLQDCRITGLQDYRITGLQDYSNAFSLFLLDLASLQWKEVALGPPGWAA